MVELAIYAFLAIFIFFRLYHSLGRASEVNFGKLKARNDDFNDSTQLTNQESINHESEDSLLLAHIEKDRIDKVKLALKNIRNKEKNFSLKNFVSCATTAFEYIHKAFNNSNTNLLSSLLDDKLYSSFIKEINNRKTLGQVHENIIVAIKSNDILNIKLVKNTAYIAMRFITEQINLIRNASGEVISGNVSKINIIEDLWEFKKDLNNTNQKWYLCSTDFKT